MNKFVLFIISLFFFVGCSSTPEETENNKHTQNVKIAYLPIIPDLPLFVAQEKGFYGENNLKAEMIKVSGSGNQVIEALARNDADFAYLAFSTILEAEQRASNSFLVFHHNIDNANTPPLYGLIVSEGTGISSIGQLKGKTIGTFPGSAMLNLTKLMLLAEGIDPENDVNLVQLPPSAQLSALKTNQVDALLSLEPTPTIAEVKKVGKVLDRTPLTPRVLESIPTGGSVVLKGKYAENPVFYNSIISAIDKAIDYIREHPEEMYQFYMKYCNVEENVARELPVLSYWKSNEIQKDVVQTYINFLTEHKVLKKPIPLEQIYANQ